MSTSAEKRVAPNIYRTPYGWRVYVRRRDPKTGKSAKRPVRFKADVTLEELEHFRDTYKLESKRLRREARLRPVVSVEASSGFTADAERYLELKTVKAMTTYNDRERDIRCWVPVFRQRPRRAITTREIDEQLQVWRNEGLAASTVNHRRTALMHLWTKLDGRAAANPVRDTREFAEPTAEPRGLPYDLVVRILDAVPVARVHSHLRPTKVTVLKTRIRLEVMAWTGMRPSTLGRLRREHVNFDEHWFVTPPSKKGGKQPRHPRPRVRKPLTTDAERALRRFFTHKCEGTFSASSARRLFVRGVRDVERELQREREDPTFRLPHIKPYDLRHSFGTEMLKSTKSLETVAELLDHTTTRMTRRYALGAIPDVLVAAAAQFQAGTTAGKRIIDDTPRPPKPPRRRRREVPDSEVPEAV